MTPRTLLIIGALLMLIGWLVGNVFELVQGAFVPIAICGVGSIVAAGLLWFGGGRTSG